MDFQLHVKQQVEKLLFHFLEAVLRFSCSCVKNDIVMGWV